MKITHKKETKQIEVESRRGKPLVDKRGMVLITKGNYKHMDKISINYLEENFKEVE